MKLIRILSLVFLILFFSVDLFAQFNKVVQVSHLGDFQPAEVTIAINPTDANNMVAAFITRMKKFPGIDNYTYVTKDGGKLWLKIHTANPENRVQGDDGVTFSSSGIVYHSYLSFYGIFGKHFRSFPSTGIYVSASLDGGLSWTTRTRVIEHLNTPNPMEDKPYVVTDNSSTSPYKGNLYLAWTHFAKYGSRGRAPGRSGRIVAFRSYAGSSSARRGVRCHPRHHNTRGRRSKRQATSI